MGGSQKWNCNLREFRDGESPGGSSVDAGRQIDAGQQILDALAKDPAGIAVSSLAYSNPNCKPLAISAGPGEYVRPSRATVMARQYPLARPVNMVVKRSADGHVDPLIKEYLAFLLGREGQRVVAEDGGYLPLSETIAGRELEKLK